MTVKLVQVGFDLLIKIKSVVILQNGRPSRDLLEMRSCIPGKGMCHRLCMDNRNGEIRCYCRPGFLLNEIDRHSCQGTEARVE